MGGSAHAAAAVVLNDYISGAFSPTPVQPLTVRDIIRRNAIQDMALAGSPEALRKLRKGVPSRKWGVILRPYICATFPNASRTGTTTEPVRCS